VFLGIFIRTWGLVALVIAALVGLMFVTNNQSTTENPQVWALIGVMCLIAFVVVAINWRNLRSW
jgi:uncharacterized membrane protein YccC